MSAATEDLVMKEPVLATRDILELIVLKNNERDRE